MVRPDDSSPAQPSADESMPDAATPAQALDGGAATAGDTAPPLRTSGGHADAAVAASDHSGGRPLAQEPSTATGARPVRPPLPVPGGSNIATTGNQVSGCRQAVCWSPCLMSTHGTDLTTPARIAVPCAPSYGRLSLIFYDHTVLLYFIILVCCYILLSYSFKRCYILSLFMIFITVSPCSWLRILRPWCQALGTSHSAALTQRSWAESAEQQRPPSRTLPRTLRPASGAWPTAFLGAAAGLLAVEVRSAAEASLH